MSLSRPTSAGMRLRASFLLAFFLPAFLFGSRVTLPCESVFICFLCCRRGWQLQRAENSPQSRSEYAFSAELHSSGQRPSRKASGLQQEMGGLGTG